MILENKTATTDNKHIFLKTRYQHSWQTQNTYKINTFCRHDMHIPEKNVNTFCNHARKFPSKRISAFRADMGHCWTTRNWKFSAAWHQDHFKTCVKNSRSPSCVLLSSSSSVSHTILVSSHCSANSEHMFLSTDPQSITNVSYDKLCAMMMLGYRDEKSNVQIGEAYAPVLASSTVAPW